MSGGIRYRVAGIAGGFLFDTLLNTVSYRVHRHPDYAELRDAGEPVIYVLWHGRLLPLTHFHRGEGIVTMASRSEDGEYISRVLARWGYGVVRGSSSRGGGVALRKAISAGRAGRSLAFTPDGPRGPKERIKPGVVTAARLTGLPLIPMAAGTGRGWWIRSWDRFLVPKPFARVGILYGAPQHVPRNATDNQVRCAGAALESALCRLTHKADSRFGLD